MCTNTEAWCPIGYFTGSIAVASVLTEICGRRVGSKGMLLPHRCDNPPCIRQEHLFLGSAPDNHRDMAKLPSTSWLRRPRRVFAPLLPTAAKSSWRRPGQVAACQALSACAACPCWAAVLSSSSPSARCGLTSNTTFLIVPVKANGLRPS
jgi:hypothetical protein